MTPYRGRRALRAACACCRSSPSAHGAPQLRGARGGCADGAAPLRHVRPVRPACCVLTLLLEAPDMRACLRFLRCFSSGRPLAPSAASRRPCARRWWAGRCPAGRRERGGIGVESGPPWGMLTFPRPFPPPCVCVLACLLSRSRTAGRSRAADLVPSVRTPSRRCAVCTFARWRVRRISHSPRCLSPCSGGRAPAARSLSLFFCRLPVSAGQPVSRFPIFVAASLRHCSVMRATDVSLNLQALLERK